MKILHVVPSYLPATRYGGPIYSVHGLCKALAELGYDVHVFTTNVDGDRDSDVPLAQPVDLDGVKVWYFPSRHLRRLYYSPSMLKTLNLELKTVDIVHLHSIFLWPTWAAARAARKNNIPYVLSPRGMLVKNLIEIKSSFVKSAWLSLIERRNLEKAAAIHVTSSVEEQEARKFNYNFPPFFAIPNGVDVSTNGVTCQVPLTHDPVPITHNRFILFLGRINWKKGLDRLIKALPHIPDIPLVIAGNDEEGYRKELDRIAGQYGVEDRIVYTGPVYGAGKKALLEQAAVFILPSYSENFGNTVLEAMAVGCPLVITPEVGAAEIVTKTGAGLVLNGSPECLGKGINELLLNPGLLKEMGENGKKTVAEHFTWSVIAKQMEKVYGTVLNA